MPKAEAITSAQNPLLKDVRLAVRRQGPTRHGWWVAETFHLLEEALRSSVEVEAVLAAESARAETERLLGRARGIKLCVLPDKLFSGVSATETAQGVIALVKPPAWSLEDLFRGTPLILVLDGVQDPGNAGTIVRAAEAFGATGAIFLKGTARPSNPKAVRAAAGSLFRVPFVTGLQGGEAVRLLEERGVKVWVAMPAGCAAPAEIDLDGPAALVIGSEAHGVSSEWSGRAAGVSIPTLGVESLNAALAAGVLLYEAQRQRSRR